MPQGLYWELLLQVCQCYCAASMGQARRISEDLTWATLNVQEKGDVQQLKKEEKASQFNKDQQICPR
jgi:hypothetical protein